MPDWTEGVTQSAVYTQDSVANHTGLLQLIGYRTHLPSHQGFTGREAALKGLDVWKLRY
jgi:hypothetical protein